MIRRLKSVYSTICVVSIFLASTLNAQSANNERTEFFAAESVPEFRIKINEKGQQKLRDAPREYVNVALQENSNQPLEKVGVKLKGSAGSYS